MTRRSQKGHAMIELAFSAMVLVSCLAGTFQFGYTFYIYNELVTAAGSGARYAATRTYRAASPEDIEKGKTAIRNMVAYGDPHPAPGSPPIAPGLTPEQVQVNWVGGAAGKPDAVDVAIVNYPVNAIFRVFTFNGRPSIEFPFVGKYAPSEREP